jgi:molybdate/tungstate transport system permease protein
MTGHGPYRYRFDPMHLIFTALGGLILVFIVAPLAAMALNSPPASLLNTATETEVRSSIILTLSASLAATILFSFAAVPLAWLLARKQFPLKRLITGIIDLPVVVPHSAAGIALIGFIAPNSLVGGAAEHLGVRFVGGPAGIITAMAFVSIPFLINAARDGFSAVPERLEKAALSLGASPIRVFFTISLPLAWRSVVSGMVMMWARGMSEFGAVAIVAYHPMVTSVLIYERFAAYGLSYARPVATLFLGVCLVFFIVVRLLSRERSHAEY